MNEEEIEEQVHRAMYLAYLFGISVDELEQDDD